jgi:hypothetical protein
MIHKCGEELRPIAHTIGSHGLTREQFEAFGVFQAAIESIRGTRRSLGEILLEVIRKQGSSRL